jgi:predicted nucleic acid-binding protein
MPTPPPFLDTNVILRHLLNDVPEQSAQARALLLRIEAGELRVRTAETVVFEIVFTLQRLYKKTPREIRDALLPILELPTISLSGKPVIREALRLYVEAALPFADAYHAALMADLGLTEIYSFDRHFDRCPGITRLEPE